jgi:8-oxo-dGTP diphosphatase
LLPYAKMNSIKISVYGVWDIEMNKIFHFVARALIIENNHVLLVREKGSKLAFLPGGHIELGESIPSALEREIKEELGLSSNVQRYIGAVEQEWGDQNENYEIHHMFEVHVKGLTTKTTPVSLEAHLEFFWFPIYGLSESNIQPYPLQQLIRNFVAGDSSAWWASTLK